jgi:hypothetical protein
MMPAAGQNDAGRPAVRLQSAGDRSSGKFDRFLTRGQAPFDRLVKLAAGQSGRVSNQPPVKLIAGRIDRWSY